MRVATFDNPISTTHDVPEGPGDVEFFGWCWKTMIEFRHSLELLLKLVMLMWWVVPGSSPARKYKSASGMIHIELPLNVLVESSIDWCDCARVKTWFFRYLGIKTTYHRVYPIHRIYRPFYCHGISTSERERDTCTILRCRLKRWGDCCIGNPLFCFGCPSTWVI